MTGELIVHKVSWFTYEAVLQSLRDLIAIHPGNKKIVVVMDNAPWHKKAKRYIATMPECADIAERIEIHSLPPYSPDLNPIERVWRIARREQTHNTFSLTFRLLQISLTITLQGLEIRTENWLLYVRLKVQILTAFHISLCVARHGWKTFAFPKTSHLNRRGH